MSVYASFIKCRGTFVKPGLIDKFDAENFCNR